MNDETNSAKAEGEELPAVTPTPAKAGFFTPIENDLERVLEAIERWYAKHFHHAVIAGVAPISADDKAALIQHVTEAVAPTKEVN